MCKSEKTLYKHAVSAKDPFLGGKKQIMKNIMDGRRAKNVNKFIN